MSVISLTQPLCRHCKRKVAKKPRGLCYTCYGRMCLRVLYPSLSKYARWRDVPQSGLVVPTSLLPVSSTNSLPGSDEKIECLKDRYARGEGLYHPKDAKGNLD